MKTIKQILRLFTGTTLLVTGLATAAPVFTPDSQPTGWLTAPALSFTTLNSGTETFYQTDFNKLTWWGNVLARDIDAYALVQTTGPWDEADPTATTAASLLDQLDYSSGRKIATLGGAFRWASLTAGEQTALGSEAILNFIRGDRSNEEPDGLSLRKRDKVLGDILHASMVFWDHGASQSLYVGANDGMLHSFDAATGQENWAYVPSMLISKLNKLAVKPYVHTHFVDGPMQIGHINISDTQKTLLVGGLGAGGAGLFALDITTPGAADETAVANKVLWEITASGDFADLGHTYAAPLLTKLPNGTPAVIVGNGYLNVGSGHAVLYVINATTGALIRAIDTGSGTTTSPNGLSSPTLYDQDFDGAPELAYAGDIDGNMWKFNLETGAVSLLFTTSPAQAITAAPVVQAHALTGQTVVFGTGRMLTSGDKSDASVHYVYGIWDGAPDANDTLLVQTLSPSTHAGGDLVRTITNYAPDWTAGTGHHFGWKVALPAGEKIVGERPFNNNGRYYFLSTNPTIGLGGDNWLHEFVITNGGSPLGPIFDLNKDGSWDDADLAADGKVPVGKYLGTGVFSQPVLVRASGYATTLYSYHPDLPVGSADDITYESAGVWGGHFDYDIYYHGPDPGTYVYTPNPEDTVIVYPYCKKPSDATKNVGNDYNGCDSAGDYKWLMDYTYDVTEVCKADNDPNKVEYNLSLTCANSSVSFTPNTSTVTYPNGDLFVYVDNYCKKPNDVLKGLGNDFNGCDGAGPDGNYKYLTDYTQNSICKPNDDPNKVEYYHTLKCNAETVEVVIDRAPYAKEQHVHEYDNKYNVTGVNMLNPSDPEFNLTNMFPDATTGFKILMMNQYLNPAVLFSAGGTPYESVQTYEGLASQTNAAALLGTLPVYTREDIVTLIFNLPKDAFYTKNWWGDNILRAGLIPTRTGCVNGVSSDGTQDTPGQLGERFNGAWAIQLIRPETPHDALELNGPDVRWGWRVKLEDFSEYVFGEYTAFWHHDYCYTEAGWVPDPNLIDEGFSPTDPWPGSADPTDTIFADGQAVVSIVETVSGATTTTVVTYEDNLTYTKVVTMNDDGSTEIHQIFRDGTEETVTLYSGDGGSAGFIDPSLGSPEEELATETSRRSWRQIYD